MRKILLLIHVIASAVAVLRADELAPQTIDSLYARASFVGIVQIEAGFVYSDKGAVYSATTIKVFKGVSVGHVYFGPYVGKEIGGKYLVFLLGSGETLKEHLCSRLKHDETSFEHLTHLLLGDSTGRNVPDRNENKLLALPCNFDTDAPFYRVMFEGFGSMYIDYFLAFNAEAAKVTCSHIILPKSLSREPIQGQEDKLWERSWVRLDELCVYLEQLENREIRKTH